jgi:alpha-1,3-rhamnosyl/mannosyltransferase
MNPEWHHSADRIRRRTPPLIRLRIATMLITHADSVRRNVIEVFQVPPGRVVSVPLAAARMFRPVTPPVRPPYFLYAGTLEPRKNLEVVLLAWRELRRLCAVDLVLAGRRREDFRLPAQEPGLEVTGEIDDNALAALYSGALAVVYPSHYEGFGLPVLEAMQCGACVFVSSDAAVREVAGNAAVVLDSGASAWLAAMRTAAGNAEWVTEWRKRSLRRAQDFSWESTTRLTYQVYEEARRRFDG